MSVLFLKRFIEILSDFANRTRDMKCEKGM